MVELERIREIVQQREEELQERNERGKPRKKGRSPKERLQDPKLVATAERVRRFLEEVPDIRRDRVEEIKKKLLQGNYEPDSKSVAEKFLQEAILNEIL